MKNYISCLFLVCFTSLMLQAQTIERSFPAGASTKITSIKPYGNDQWILAGRGEPEQGSSFADTLFLIILDHNGNIQLRKNLNMPNAEQHGMGDFIVFPDGGIFTPVSSSFCEPTIEDIYTIQKLDPQGNLIWEKMVPGGNAAIWRRWFLAPDGNLIMISDKLVKKVSSNTGDVLWEADILAMNGEKIIPSEIVLIPGTEDFFAFGQPDCQVWRQTGPPGSMDYVLENSLEFDGFPTELTAGGNGWFYFYQAYPNNKIVRINVGLQREELPILIYESEYIINLAASVEGLYLGRAASVERYDFQGLNPVLVVSYNQWKRPRFIVAHNGWLAVGGENEAGNPTWIPPWWINEPRRSTAVWLRSSLELSPSLEEETPNASVLEVEQLNIIDTSRFPILAGGYYYNLMGGAFRVKVGNLGNIPIHKICINTSFRRNELDLTCEYNYSTNQKCFSNLNLSPGDSIWLDFGGIEAYGQAALPVQLSFWTSSPNDQPDSVQEDDLALHHASYTVATKDPNIAQVALTPNPANDFTTLVLAEKLENEPWRIFDTSGQVVSAGVSNADQTLRVETAQLPNGIYFFHLKNRVGKLVVQH